MTSWQSILYLKTQNSSIMQSWELQTRMKSPFAIQNSYSWADYFGLLERLVAARFYTHHRQRKWHKRTTWLQKPSIISWTCTYTTLTDGGASHHSLPLGTDFTDFLGVKLELWVQRFHSMELNTHWKWSRNRINVRRVSVQIEVGMNPFFAKHLSLHNCVCEEDDLSILCIDQAGKYNLQVAMHKFQIRQNLQTRIWRKKSITIPQEIFWAQQAHKISQRGAQPPLFSLYYSCLKSLQEVFCLSIVAFQ